MPIKLALEDAPDFFGKQMPKAIRIGVANGLYSAALRGVVEIQTRIIPQLVPQPVDRGVYKAGWMATRDNDGASIENSAPHASFIENGVRASSIKIGKVMIEALTEWVIRKGLVSETILLSGATAVSTSDAVSIAWSIARGMKRKGIFGQGLQVVPKLEELLPEIIGREVTREVTRAIESAEGGALIVPPQT
jgi:hypothetical protein